MSENEDGTDSHQEKEEDTKEKSLSRRSSELSHQSNSTEFNLSEKSWTSNFESDNYSSFTDDTFSNTLHSINDNISSFNYIIPELIIRLV